jgi:hypothetical protein
MKIVKILGGLGNQMFQYAFYKSLLKEYSKVKADISDFKYYSLHNKYELHRIFKINVPQSTYLDNFILGGHNRDVISRLFKKTFNRKPKSYYSQVDSIHFDNKVYSDVESCYLDGYWQNFRYFSSICDEIRKEFSFPAFQEVHNIKFLKEINSVNSISIHVRRGDYVGHSLLGEICNLEYYTQAIQYFDTMFPKNTYFVFSNDIEWCKINLPFNNNVFFIDNNQSFSSYRDMQLMSSSFSWWGAWLNPNEHKKVIAPKSWFNTKHDINDIVPYEWITI